MKYVIILPDGAADEPLPQLQGRTPLQVAKLPHMHWVAEHGELGLVHTVPAGFIPGTDVATLSLLGYDPHRYYSGRAPLEAIARGIQTRADQLVFRCNFVTLAAGRMKDFTAGHIQQADADVLVATLDQALRHEGCRFHSGVSYRNLMLLSHASDLAVQCVPPHDIADQEVSHHWPQGPGATRVMQIMRRATEILAEHPVNQRRRRQGEDWATDIWLWGQGQPRTMESFQSRHGLRAAVITGVDILRGIARGAGMDLIEVPGATGYIDTDYAAKGRAAVAALDNYDMVIVHVEAPDEAGHQGNAPEKIKALEQIDLEIVGPLLSALGRYGSWRMLLAPDHPTPVSTKAHSAVAPPYCFAGHDIRAQSGRRFTEDEAKTSGLFIQPGIELLTRFLRPG